ncbi:hypothetical protein HaLaN_29702, partial [Haematococcus lacustris]
LLGFPAWQQSVLWHAQNITKHQGPAIRRQSGLRCFEIITNCDVQPPRPGMLSHELQRLMHGCRERSLYILKLDPLHCGHELHQLLAYCCNNNDSYMASHDAGNSCNQRLPTDAKRGYDDRWAEEAGKHSSHIACPVHLWHSAHNIKPRHKNLWHNTTPRHIILRLSTAPRHIILRLSTTPRHIILWHSRMPRHKNLWHGIELRYNKSEEAQPNMQQGTATHVAYAGLLPRT